MEKKKSKGVIIIIVILVLALLGLGGYIIYDKILSKDNNEPAKTEKKEEKKEKESENLDSVAQILVNKLDKYYVDYYDKNDKVDFANMDDNSLIEGAFIYGKDFNLKKSIVDDYYNNLFGRTLTNYPDFNCWSNDGIYAKYNASISEYETQDGHNHGGICAAHALFTKYNNIEKNGENYIITVTKVFGPSQGVCSESPENAFYADSKYTVKIDGLNQFTKTDNYGNWDLPDKEGAKNYYEQNYEQFKNIMPQYKYTFKKAKNDYYLTNFEMVK